ncbi:interleukin-6 isoform X2 [Triplophysa dalaica]|uniref:interleukin-6 isoform X2 n=1 Tax=Triplophysa dalaica TaxID=1582913 RepID=UPI0024DF5A9A|nr:interleukin-6 isoform X2 [Triplophysa dalaica]
MMLSTLSVQLSVLLPVFFCLLDASPLYSTEGELSEISGDDIQEVNVRALITEEQRWHLMARQLHRDVKTLRDEQFDRDFRDPANMTSFEGLRTNTPVLKASDGCLSRNFNRERCLGRVYSVLMWYAEHLSYIERENLTQTHTNDVKHGTKRFLESIYSQVQLRDTQVEDFPRSSLQAKSAWTRKTLVHSILFNFTNVMIDTCRAIHYMSKRITGDGHQRKHRKKASDWISDKN